MAFSQWIEADSSNGADSIYQVKEMMKAAGWSVLSSSDGTTYNGAGDQISSGGSGAGGMDNTNAWFRIQNPDGVEFTFQRVNLSYYFRVKCSPVNGFTQNQDGGGSPPDATHTPYATDQGVLIGSGTDASPTGNFLFPNSGTWRFKGGADSASPYHFWSAAFPVGGGVVNHFLAFEGLDACEPTDAAPFHVYIGSSSDPGRGTLGAETGSGTSVRSWATVASTTPSTWTIMPAHYLTTATSFLFPSASVVNPITGKDEVYPIGYGRRSGLGNPGWKGVGSMVQWNGVLRTTGDTMTVSTTRDRIVFYEVSMPWQGTVPTV